MSLLTNKLSNRANVMTLALTIALADFTSTAGGKTANVIDIPMPFNAEIVGGGVVVDEAFNGTGTDVLDIGDSAVANRYNNDINLEAAVGTRVALVPTGFLTTATNSVLRLTRVPGGSDATAGKIRLLVQYVEYDKGLFIQE